MGRGPGFFSVKEREKERECKRERKKKQGKRKDVDFPKLPKEAKSPKHDSVQCSNSIGMNESGSGLCATCTDLTQECICTYNGPGGNSPCTLEDHTGPWSCGIEDPQEEGGTRCSSSIIDDENTDTTDVGHKHCPVFSNNYGSPRIPHETEDFTSLGFSIF